MDCNQILLLGLGIEAPWKLVEQRLDMDKNKPLVPSWRFPVFREAGAWAVKYGNSLFIQISAPQQNLWVAEVGLRQMIRSVLSG